MSLGRKKAFIYDWWVAEKDNQFKFVDITKKENITSSCVIVGRISTMIPGCSTSKHNVLRVTKKGVYTASGRFYPFRKAHPLYMLFLSEIHIPVEALIASKWECIDVNEQKYIADIEYPSGEIKKDVIFDFVSMETYSNAFVGISDTLDDVVVFNVFDAKDMTDGRTIQGSVSSDIYELAYELKSYRKEAIKDVRKLIKENKK